MGKLSLKPNRFIRNQDGVTAIEYAIMASALAGALAVAVLLVSGAIELSLTDVANLFPSF